MRNFAPCLLSVVVATVFAGAVQAQTDASLVARIAARRDLERAKTNLRYYWQVEYPRQRRNLDAAVELTQMELKNLNTQLREFRPFTQFSIGEPFPLTVRCLQMRIKEAELRLDNLQAERNALTRFHSDDFNALAADVFEARARVLELEPKSAEATEAVEPLPPNGQ